MVERKRKEIQSPILLAYLDSINEASSKYEISKRLRPIEDFTLQKYSTLIDEDFIYDRLEGEVKNVRNDHTGLKIDVYKYFNEYGNFLRAKNPKISRSRMKLLYHSAKKALNHSTGNLIINDTFSSRVNNLPPQTKNKKTTITKENMTEFLHELMSINSDLRVRALTMLLVSSGIRIGEALQIKVKDLNFEANPPRINLSVEITKMGVERDVYLTHETVKVLKNWIQYKHRIRNIVKYENGKPVKHQYVKPENIEESYLFKIRGEFEMNKYENTEVNNYKYLYDDARSKFKKLVDEIFIKKHNLGKKFPNGRNSISLHSLRWFVRTTVKTITGDEKWGYYWIGKENETYQFEPTEEEIRSVYSKIEPALTFLDPKIIIKMGEGQQAQIDYLNKQMELQSQLLKQQEKRIKESNDQTIYFAFKFEMERFARQSKEITLEDIAKDGGRPKVFEWSHKQQIDYFIERMGKMGKTVSDEQKEALRQYLKKSNQPTMIWRRMTKEDEEELQKEEEYNRYMEEEYEAEQERLSKMTPEEIEAEEKRSLELHAKLQRECNKMSPAEMENESRLYDRLAQKNAR
ncbi:MAG TPA: site-specific integrase [Nitrososphaeraceae archaeon]